MRIEMPRGPAPEMKKKVQIVDNRIPELPVENIESMEDENTGKLEIGLAEAGSRGEVAESKLEVSRINRPEAKAKAKENAAIIAVKKLEAGMDPEDLKEMLTGELEEVEDVIESLEDDQPVMLDSAISKRENLMAQLKAVQEYQATEKAA
jgi:hypothetical protein